MAWYGHSVASAIIFDRDYRTIEECRKIKEKLSDFTEFVHILERKELENYLLVPAILKRSIENRLSNIKNKKINIFTEDVLTLLLQFTDEMKHDIFGQFSSHHWNVVKAHEEGIDASTIYKQLMIIFDTHWNDLDSRLKMVPGKKLLAILNAFLSEKYGISLTPFFIISNHKKSEIPTEIRTLLDQIEKFRKE